MALTFNKLKGEAQKGKIESYTYVEGDNVVRMVGDVCARYVYWLKGENDKTYNIGDIESNAPQAHHALTTLNLSNGSANYKSF